MRIFPQIPLSWGHIDEFERRQSNWQTNWENNNVEIYGTCTQHSDCGHFHVLAHAPKRGSGAGDTATGRCLDQRL